MVMKKEQIVSIIGNLAMYYQELPLDEACQYYDEVISLEEVMSAIEVYLVKAKLYRDAFFINHNGDQLPEHSNITRHNVEQLEDLVKAYV
jgi:hypothetical protein